MDIIKIISIFVSNLKFITIDKKTLNFVSRQLHIIRKFNYESEVFTYVLKFMKENPKLTIEECILMAMNEFDI